MHYDSPVTTTAPPAPPAPFDTSNTLLGEQPAQLTTAIVTAPTGQQRLALTVRTPSATVTVFLAGQDARAWAARLTTDAGAMSVAGLVVANGTVPGR